MRRVLLCSMLFLFLAACGQAVTLDVAVDALPSAPSVEFPAIEVPVGWAPPVAIPLPVPRDVSYGDHAVNRHGQEAHRARRIATDDHNPCQHFSCDSSRDPNRVLRLCWSEYDQRFAVQWLAWDPAVGGDGGWYEGTSFLQTQNRAESYLRHNGCVPIY
jgi:hypothetical protein